MIELIVHYNSDSTEDSLIKTLNSVVDQNITIDSIRLCFNPPAKVPMNGMDNLIQQIGACLGKEVSWNIQILSDHQSITSVINSSAEQSGSQYYIFVNCGYEFTNDEISQAIAGGQVLFADAVDDKYNEFTCITKLHKLAGGFSYEHALPEKIEKILAYMEELRNERETVTA